jgi:hypothetical protein
MVVAREPSPGSTALPARRRALRLPTSSPQRPRPHGQVGELDPASIAGVVNALSSALTQLHQARAQLPGEVPVAARLGRAVDDLEAIGQQLLARQEVEPTGWGEAEGPVRIVSVSEADQSPVTSEPTDEERFVHWLTSCERSGGPDPDYEDEWVAELPVLLGRLTTSTEPLAAEAARVLGHDGGISIGDAATELLLAVGDPAGPRCRSYRAAVYFLRERVGDWFSLDMEERA